jgi:hypothetical protein
VFHTRLQNSALEIIAPACSQLTSLARVISVTILFELKVESVMKITRRVVIDAKPIG